MPLHILIIPDKFKGTLSAADAAQALARGWRAARPADTLELVPMSDGGDGFGEVMCRLLHARVRSVQTMDAAHRPLRARWWWEPRSRTALIESARIIGLAQLPPARYHPFELDTFGLGRALEAAARIGARRCLIGIGGSATNDGGFGMARALGWQFLDRQGRPMEHWTAMNTLARIRPPRKERLFPELLVAVDVQNPLLGKRGATRVYGPQKGLRPDDFPRAESALHRLVAIARNDLGCDHARCPGAGAAGGLGFGLMTFLGARPKPGFDLFAAQAGLRRRLRQADVVLTGEGALDRSTLMGKGVGEIAQLCQVEKVPCIGVAGMVTEPASLERRFRLVRVLIHLTTLENAKARPAYWLEQLAARVAGEFAATE